MIYLNIYSGKFKIYPKKSTDAKQIMYISDKIYNELVHKYYIDHYEQVNIKDTHKTYCIEYGDFDGADYTANEVLNLLMDRNIIDVYLCHILKTILDMYPGTTPMICTKNRNIILCNRPIQDVIYVNVLNYADIIDVIIANNKSSCIIL